MNEVLNFYFNFKGYANRKQYWLYLFLPLVSFFAFKYALIEGQGRELSLPFMVSLAVNIFVVYISLAVHVKRLRDAGFSIWWVLLMIIPFFGNIIMTIICGFFPTKTKSEKADKAIIPQDNSETILDDDKRED